MTPMKAINKQKIPKHEQERMEHYIEYLKAQTGKDNVLAYNEWKECRIHGPSKNPHLFALPSIVSSTGEKVELPRCAVLNNSE